MAQSPYLQILSRKMSYILIFSGRINIAYLSQKQRKLRLQINKFRYIYKAVFAEILWSPQRLNY